MRSVVAALITVTLLLTSFGGHAVASDSSFGTIVITVRDKDGRPVPSAFMSENINIEMNIHYFADAQGRVVLSMGANAPTGSICANSSGTVLPYWGSACVDHLVVSPGATLAVDLVLLPTVPGTPTLRPSGGTPPPTASTTATVPSPVLDAPLSPLPQPCQFVLGFRALHDFLPAVVGDCLDNEGHSPQNGDGLQHTTKGLLVWRKVDNFTAFTDGYRTWVNGPNGVQERLNTQRFSWEVNLDGLPLAP